MAERDTPDLPDDDPTPTWLHAALDAAPPVDELTRERHIRVALAAFDDEHDRRVPARRGGGARWLAVAAALLVALGVGGVWVSSSDRGSDSSSDQVADRESAPEATTSAESSDSGDDAGATTLAPSGEGFGTLSPSVAEDADRQTAAAPDLGTFATDAQLRLAIAGIAADTTAEATLPGTAPSAAGGATPGCIVPPVPPGSVMGYTATVDGVRVEAWVTASPNGPAITVVDAETCTVRPA